MKSSSLNIASDDSLSSTSLRSIDSSMRGMGGLLRRGVRSEMRTGGSAVTDDDDDDGDEDAG